MTPWQEIFSAARDGDLNTIKTILACKSEIQKKNVVDAKENGTTPMLIACKNGHLPVVAYFVRVCSADIEMMGSITFDGETIESAPPLWCAAASGFLNIVKFLIDNGADVNKTTATNSTALRAACFDGHFAVVKYLIESNCDIEIANRHGHTCLMIASYKGHYDIVEHLLNKKARINRRSLKGNTALHDCAESGSLNILKLLLQRGAIIEADSHDITPVMAAAVTGHTHVVEYFIEQSYCSKLEQIQALELLGSTYVDKKQDHSGALKLWKRAMVQRLILKGEHYVDRIPTSGQSCLRFEISTEEKPAYNNVVEAKSMEEVDNLILDPEAMKMEALVKRERILGPSHPDTSYHIRYRGAVYADNGYYDKCMVLWNYALDMQQKFLEPLHVMTQSSFLSFAELFFFMEAKRMKYMDGKSKINMNDMLSVFSKAMQEIQNGVNFLNNSTLTEKEEKNWKRMLVIIMHILSLISKKLENCDFQQTFSFKKMVYDLVHFKLGTSKQFFPLHLACSEDTSSVGRYKVCTFPTLDVISLLLEVGANPNSRDCDGNTPLHIVMQNKLCDSEVVKLLLNSEAHFDEKNKDKKTAADYLTDVTIYDIVSPMKYINLQCLCARVIQEHKLDYKGHVSEKLEQLIDIH